MMDTIGTNVLRGKSIAIHFTLSTGFVSVYACVFHTIWNTFSVLRWENREGRGVSIKILDE